MTVRELRRDRVPDERDLPPELTFVFIHHAGGSASAYLPFVRHLPGRWRVIGLELPARFPFVKQAACRSMTEAVDWMMNAVWAEVSGPFAVFGHSMGALVAYELVRELEERGRPPVWLGLSASAAPHLAAGHRRHHWPHERLLRFMRHLGGTPDELWRQPHVLERMTHCLRNDLAIVDTYEHRGGPPLSTPMSVYSGAADPVIGDALMQPWIDHASEVVSHRTWPGGHFYLFDQVDEVCARIVEDVHSVMSREPAMSWEPAAA
jgi:surfactin synthase thioesterase subunit